MLRLTTVFLIWIASTACALEQGDADYDADLHEAYVSAERAAELRLLLDKYERSYYSAADVDRGAAQFSPNPPSGRKQR